MTSGAASETVSEPTNAAAAANVGQRWKDTDGGTVSLASL